MRKKMLAVAAVVAVFVAPLLAGATPAAAHGGHTECRGGMLLLVDAGEPWPESGPGEGPLGSDIVELAHLMVDGTLEPGEPPLLAHQIFCGTYEP